MAGFGDFSGRYQRQGWITGGIRFECGEFTCVSTSLTNAVPTNLNILYGGFAIAECTLFQIGHATSICKSAGGPWIDWSFSDATMSHAQFVAFGV